MVPYFEVPPIHFGPLKIAVFPLLIAVAIVVGAFTAERRARRIGLDPTIVRRLERLCVVASMICAHLVHVLFYHPEELSRPWSLVMIFSGMSSTGGMTGAAIAVVIYLKRKRLPVWAYADVLIFGFFHAWFFGRMGCALVHDHPGRLTDFFLAVKFPFGKRHDLGLYEFLLCAFWIPLVRYIGRENSLTSPPPGTMLAIMSIAYAVPRFFLDTLRATDTPYHDARYFGLTFAQYACIVCMLVSARLFVKLKAMPAIPR